MLKLILCENETETELCTYHIEHKQAEIIKKVIDDYLTSQAEIPLLSLPVKKQDRVEHILLSQVSYFVSDRRKIKTLFLSGDSIEFYMKMKELDEKLSKFGFVRCHQSYLVNIKQILYWDDLYIHLIGDETIPISRKYKETVIQLLTTSGKKI